MLSSNVRRYGLLDFRLHCPPRYTSEAYNYSRSKRSLLGPTSHWWFRLHRLRHYVHVGNPEEVVFTCSKRAGMAYWRLEFDRRWWPLSHNMEVQNTNCVGTRALVSHFAELLDSLLPTVVQSIKAVLPRSGVVGAS